MGSWVQSLTRARDGIEDVSEDVGEVTHPRLRRGHVHHVFPIWPRGQVQTSGSKRWSPSVHRLTATIPRYRDRASRLHKIWCRGGCTDSIAMPQRSAVLTLRAYRNSSSTIDGKGREMPSRRS